MLKSVSLFSGILRKEEHQSAQNCTCSDSSHTQSKPHTRPIIIYFEDKERGFHRLAKEN